MRILIHSNAPWVKTAYGQQTELFATRARDMGHDVAVSAFYGLAGSEVAWNDIPVFPAGVRPDAYGMDMIPYFYEKWNADIALILADAWVGAGHAPQLSKLNVANWLPIDAYPLSRRDLAYLLASGAYPIAMSRFGERMLTDEGLPALYAPHAVDTSIFAPWEDSTDRDQLRHEAGIEPDTFVVGINAANRDFVRKGFFEQFSGFAAFHEKHQNSRLYVHTVVDHPAGLDIVSLTDACGIREAVIFPEQGVLAAGEIDSRSLVRNFYHMIDLYSGCAVAEGFGVPIVEAQACGIPVVVTDASAMTELCAPSGMLVQGEPMWVEGHQSRWVRPSIKGIAAAYEQMYHLWHDEAGMGDACLNAREFAMQYDVTRVATEHWAPVLKELEERL